MKYLIFLQPYKKYANFKGRASRLEFWSFFAFYQVCETIFVFIGGKFGFLPYAEVKVLFGLFVAISLIPYIAVAVRRLHDFSESGWWILFPPLALVMMFRKGDEGENRFGPDPKQENVMENIILQLLAVALGLTLWVLSVLWTITAIVAIFDGVLYSFDSYIARGIWLVISIPLFIFAHFIFGFIGIHNVWEWPVWATILWLFLPALPKILLPFLLRFWR